MPKKIQRSPLTPTEIKAVANAVQAELAGKSQNTAAQQTFPNQTPGAAAVSMSRTLKKANVQDELARVFADNGITIEAAVAPIGKALVATHKVRINGEIVNTGIEDLEMQLKGSDRALKLMGITGNSEGNTTINNFVVMSKDQREKYGI